jgi:hypothetical protein
MSEPEQESHDGKRLGLEFGILHEQAGASPSVRRTCSSAQRKKAIWTGATAGYIKEALNRGLEREGNIPTHVPHASRLSFAFVEASTRHSVHPSHVLLMATNLSDCRVVSGAAKILRLPVSRDGNKILDDMYVSSLISSSPRMTASADYELPVCLTAGPS